MKLRISKICIVLLPIAGTIALFAFTFMGDISYGWGIFVIAILLSGLINRFFFRCPHCGKTISANLTLNQKYCPMCGEDLGLTDMPFSYYSKCPKDRNGVYRAYTTSGILGGLVGTAIVLFIVAALFGVEKLFRGSGRLLLLAAVVLGLLIGMMCRCIVGSAAKLDEKHLYFNRIPGRWNVYDIEDIRKWAGIHKPFYHIVRGYVMLTSKGIIAIPVATYKGGQEFLQKLTEQIGEPMVNVMPENTASKHSETGKRDEQRYKEYKSYVR